MQRKTFWRLIIIVVIVVVILGVVLHYFQAKHGEHYRTNRPPIKPADSEMMYGDAGEPKKSGQWQRVQQGWQDFWYRHFKRKQSPQQIVDASDHQSAAKTSSTQKAEHHHKAVTGVQPVQSDRVASAEKPPDATPVAPVSPPSTPPSPAPSSPSSTPPSQPATPARTSPAQPHEGLAWLKRSSQPGHMAKRRSSTTSTSSPSDSASSPSDSASSAPASPHTESTLPTLAQHGRHAHHMKQHLALSKNTAQAVHVMRVAKRASSLQLPAVGTLKARQQINIAPQIAGLVVSISFTPGSYVVTGTPLVRLDNRIYKANLAEAKSALVLSESKYNRYKILSTKEVLAPQQLAEAKATYQEDLAKVQVNQTYLEQTVLRAPFSGYVGDHQVSVGDYVTGGQHLTTLVNRRDLLVSYLLPGQYQTQLHLGQAVQVTVSGVAKKIQAKVVYVAPTIDSVTHSIMVQAGIDNADNQLTPGAFARVSQTISAARMVMMVPSNSIVAKGDERLVYRVVNDRVQAVPVKLGDANEGWTTIRSGLQVGDQIVTAGQQQLSDGAAVNILP